jgi:uncharacterized membrane protein
MRFAPLALALGLAALSVSAGPASAGFTVCNKSGQTAKVALGRFDGRSWGSEGWWSIGPSSCTKLIARPLDARYYYLYATDSAAGTWDGGKNFCTGQGMFTIVGRGSCAARGFDRKGFFEVDTGQNPDWTQNLSD